MEVVRIEDEAVTADGLANLLGRYSWDIQIVERLDSVEEAVLWFVNNPSPRLVLLDIQLADGLCFDIFPQVNIRCPIIFTAYDQYAIRAFQVTSIDYLLKPIAYADLHRALEKLRLLTTEYAPLPEMSLRQLADVFQKIQKPYKTRFLARNNDRL
jgi:two-component SAPR family response regulator